MHKVNESNLFVPPTALSISATEYRTQKSKLKKKSLLFAIFSSIWTLFKRKVFETHWKRFWKGIFLLMLFLCCRTKKKQNDYGFLFFAFHFLYFIFRTFNELLNVKFVHCSNHVFLFASAFIDAYACQCNSMKIPINQSFVKKVDV